GGIEALGREVAEDAAATKIVRDAGLNVRLVDRPLAQPLGRRSAREVWNRQLRWARLRRASFFMCFLPEILSGGVLPIICAAIVAHALGWPVSLSTAAFALIWYGSEMALAAASGWHLSALHPVYGLIRDLMLPASPHCAATISSGVAPRCRSSALGRSGWLRRCGRAGRTSLRPAEH